MLQFLKKIELPPEENCSFDHGDVDQTTGRVYVAHTSSGTVEVFDGQQERWTKKIPDCAGGSGVIFDAINNRIFAASRSAGHILSIEGNSTDVVLKFETGKKPNGLAVDGERGILMTADVGDNYARFHSQNTGEVLASVKLSGRPRWSAYRKASDQYFINIMEPSGVEFISGKNFSRTGFYPIDQMGPHGLVIVGSFAYVASDDATLSKFNIDSKELAGKAALAGPPDVLWHNAKQNLVYCSIGDPGVVQVFDGKTLEIVQEVKTEYDSHTLTFDEKRQKLYTFQPDSHSVGVYQA